MNNLLLSPSLAFVVVVVELFSFSSSFFLFFFLSFSSRCSVLDEVLSLLVEVAYC